MQSSYADLSSSITILQKNDALLKNKILGLPAGIKYKDRILEYFEQSLSIANSSTCNYTGERTGKVTSMLRLLWEVEFEKGKTFQVFKDFEELENVFFDLEKYRGHYVHQFNVFLLGYYVVNKFAEYREAFQTFKNSSNDPIFTWVLASTFHDMGYPIEKMDEWFERYLDMFLKVKLPYKIEIERLLTPVFFEYVKYLSETHLNLGLGRCTPFGQETNRDWNFHNVLLMNLRKKDHGVISALLLIHSLFTQEELAKKQDWFYGTFPRDIMPACHAISLHNLQEKNLKIGYKKYPFAFLLRLCDELQDWGRSKAGYDQSELVEFEIKNEGDIPTISSTLKVNDSFFEQKAKSINFLCDQLQTDGLLRVVISLKSKGNDSNYRTFAFP